MSNSFLAALSDRVLVADGARGTMLQAADLEVAYPAVEADCVETNTFGANLANLGDYDIQDRIRELSLAGAAVAREAADNQTLRDAYHENAAGLILGGADALIIETCQNLLRTKAAVVKPRSWASWSAQ